MIVRFFNLLETSLSSPSSALARIGKVFPVVRASWRQEVSLAEWGLHLGVSIELTLEINAYRKYRGFMVEIFNLISWARCGYVLIMESIINSSMSRVISQGGLPLLLLPSVMTCLILNSGDEEGIVVRLEDRNSSRCLDNSLLQYNYYTDHVTLPDMTQRPHIWPYPHVLDIFQTRSNKPSKPSPHQKPRTHATWTILRQYRRESHSNQIYSVHMRTGPNPKI